MADNARVLDCRVDELQANLNALTDPYIFSAWNWYERGEERRVSVVLIRVVPGRTQLPVGFDPYKMRSN